MIREALLHWQALPVLRWEEAAQAAAGEALTCHCGHGQGGMLETNSCSYMYMCGTCSCVLCIAGLHDDRNVYMYMYLLEVA